MKKIATIYENFIDKYLFDPIQIWYLKSQKLKHTCDHYCYELEYFCMQAQENVDKHNNNIDRKINELT